MRPYELLHLQSCPNRGTTDRQFQQIAADLLRRRASRHPDRLSHIPRRGRLRAWLRRSGSPIGRSPEPVAKRVRRRASS